MSSTKKSIEVAFQGKSVRVSWYAGASDDSIRKVLCAGLALPDGTPLVLRDSDGDLVAISDSLPSGLKLAAEVEGAAPAPRTITQPRGPKPYPFVGNLLEIFGKEGTFPAMMRLCREYGEFV